MEDFLGVMTATNGINATYAFRNGEPGTALFITIPPPGGTVFMVR
jgi:hypothetical protein